MSESAENFVVGFRLSLKVFRVVFLIGKFDGFDRPHLIQEKFQFFYEKIFV